MIDDSYALECVVQSGGPSREGAPRDPLCPIWNEAPLVPTPVLKSAQTITGVAPR